MANYIDGFVLPIPRRQLEPYRRTVEQVAHIWKEHGALDYAEFVIDDRILKGTRSFMDAANANDDETVIFGWVTFESRGSRDLANEKVSSDPRMADLINPLTETTRPIYEAARMVYGGFKPLVQLSASN